MPVILSGRQSALTAGSLYTPYISSISASGRYLLDQRGNPFLLVGDSSWEIAVNLSSSDADSLLSTRASQGFNTCLLNAIASNYDNNAYDAANVSDTWKALDGTPPFYQSNGSTLGTSPANYDCTQPYPPYWAKVDAVVESAKNYGITIQMDGLGECVFGATSGGGTTLDQAFYGTMGQTKLNTFATWIANRYMPYGNVTWLLGADYFPSVQGSGNNTALVGMAQSMVTAQSSSLITCEANDGIHFSSTSANLDLTTDLSIFTTGTPSGSQVKAGIITVYDSRPGGPGPGSSPDFYRAYNISPAAPLIHGEGAYENVTGGKGASTVALSQQLCRAYVYCAILCGATGWFYGDNTVWFNGTNWRTYLNEPGQVGVSYAAKFFRSYNWWRLIPDQTASFVTSVNSAAPSTWATGPSTVGGASSNYGGAAAITTLGDLGLVYCFQNDTVTIAMSLFRATVTARWWDPTNGTYTSIGTYSNTGSHTFSTSSTNNNSQTDWVLVLTA